MTDAASRQLPATGLSPQQVAFFGAFGFVHVPGFLGDDTQRVIDAFEQVFAEHEAVESFPEVHFGGRNLALPYLIDLHPDLAPLRTDPRILGVVESLIGEDHEYRESAGNIYDCDTAWHCDIYDSPLDQFHIKFLFYLDPLEGARPAPCASSPEPRSGTVRSPGVSARTSTPGPASSSGSGCDPRRSPPGRCRADRVISSSATSGRSTPPSVAPPAVGS